MQIRAIDHFVLVVLSIEKTVKFYKQVLGLEAREMAPGRWSLHPARGAGDFCLLTDTPIAEVVRHLAAQGVDVICGPIRRTGATGPLLSVYFYDPDENLVEVSNLVD